MTGREESRRKKIPWRKIILELDVLAQFRSEQGSHMGVKTSKLLNNFSPWLVSVLFFTSICTLNFLQDLVVSHLADSTNTSVGGCLAGETHLQSALLLSSLPFSKFVLYSNALLY